MIGKILRVGCLGLLCSLVGCTYATPYGGWLYSDVTTGAAASIHKLGTKVGEACASNILGIIATGDASVAAAAKNGGLTRVASVDSHATNILGLYAKLCTKVKGE